jgi:hypothetical protein
LPDRYDAGHLVDERLCVGERLVDIGLHAYESTSSAAWRHDCGQVSVIRMPSRD